MTTPSDVEARLAQAGHRRSVELERIGIIRMVLVDAVEAAHAEGMSPTHIASCAGISRQTVHAILKR